MTVELLRQLVDATVLPPPDGDVDALLAAFAAMYEARQELLAAASPPVAVDCEEGRTLVTELAARDAAWTSALASALDAVGTARRNANRLRTYAR